MRILWIRAMNIDKAIDIGAYIEIINRISKKENIRVFVTYKKNKQLKHGGCEHLELVPSIPKLKLGSMSFLFLAALRVFKKLIKGDVDVVITTPFSSLIMLLPFNLIVFRKKRMIWIIDCRTIPVEVQGIRGKIKELVFDISYKLGRKIADGFTVISPFMREFMVQKYNLQTARVGIWSSGVNLEFFNPQKVSIDRITQLKSELGLINKFVVLYHGSISRNRGLKNALLAFKESPLNEIDEIVFLIIGDGPYFDELKNFIKQFKLIKRVQLLPKVPYEQVPYYISIADVGILPFPKLIWWRVSSPLKLMEYLAMEKPVILTKIEAHTDIPDIHSAAFWVEESTSVAIMRGILNAFENRHLLNDMGRVGRSIVERYFSWERQVDNLLQFIREIWGKKYEGQ